MQLSKQLLALAARTQNDGHLHLEAVEELQLSARAVPGGVHPKRVWRPLLLKALVERLGTQIRLEVHLRGHSASVSTLTSTTLSIESPSPKLQKPLRSGAQGHVDLGKSAQSMSKSA